MKSNKEIAEHIVNTIASCSEIEPNEHSLYINSWGNIYTVAYTDLFSLYREDICNAIVKSLIEQRIN